MSARDPYFIDFAQRVRDIQAGMQREGIDVYLGSRLRTLSWITDVFFPWRSYIVIPVEGASTVFTFLIDAARAADDCWLEPDQILGYGPMGGQDQISLLSNTIRQSLKSGKGVVGIESGMGTYLPEGHITLYEYESLRQALPSAEFRNAHELIDRLSLIKDEGTINRFREASRIVDVGHQAVYDAIKGGGYRGMSETEVAGIAGYAMRKEGSVWDWTFTGGQEIASGHRTGYAGGACTPATGRVLGAGEPLMVDLHAMFKLALGDHTHNYLLGPVTERQRWHADNFVRLMEKVLMTYKAGVTPSSLADEVIDYCEEHDFAEFLVPGFEHGIGLLGDEWRIGVNDGPLPYWTNPDHVYQAGELIICAVQYACPQEEIGFRYENPMLITEEGSEVLSKFPLSVEEI
jgi:Xaa-Pro aminopeptidase